MNSHIRKGVDVYIFLMFIGGWGNNKIEHKFYEIT